MKKPASSTRYDSPAPLLRSHGLLILRKRGIRAVRDVRLALLELAQGLASDPSSQGWLVLAATGLTLDRLRTELQQVSGVLRPELAERLHIAVGESAPFRTIPSPAPAQLSEVLGSDRVHDSARPVRVFHPRTAAFVVGKHMLAGALTKAGPMSIKSIMETTGLSYPTVTSVLRSYGSLVHRPSDRSAELSYFSIDLVHQIMASTRSGWRTVRFSAPRHEIQSPEYYVNRLTELRVPRLALGGVLGAYQYVPDLDITGPPRLDLTLHSDTTRPDLGFVRRLGHQLELDPDPLSPPTMVIHIATERDPGFIPRPAGLAYASPMDCLLDLFEMQLGSQAKQFIDEFEGKERAHGS